jgi:carbamoyltransferase
MAGDWVLGLGGSSHDFSAALLHDTDIKVAVEQERVSRRKHGTAEWFEDPVRASVDYCLDAAGITRGDISRVVSSDLLPHRARRACAGIPTTLYPHHLCHAASVYMMVPPDTRAAIIVVDGMGSVIERPGAEAPAVDRETFSFYLAHESRIELLGATRGEGLIEHVHLANGCTNSLGLLYELVTSLLGFHVLDVGKTMGLAGWGRPRFVEELRRFTRIGQEFDCVFDFDPFSGVDRALSSLLDRGRRSFQVRADLAASVQQVFTDTLLRCYDLVSRLDFDVLCLAGGCALNTVANGALACQLPGDRRLVIAPHSSDAGVGLGALWLHSRDLTSAPPRLALNGRSLSWSIARPGRCYDAAAVQAAIAAHYPRLARDSSMASPAALARFIADGRVLGFFNGASEIGPRALGGRSILADPRSSAIRERVNRQLKLREPFRPLAPMVLDEHFEEYFTPAAAMNQFMLTVAQATERCRQAAPGVVHVDGSARVQVVDDETDPLVAALLREFRDLTGVPILLNTSFNRRGEPIVESPADAVDAFLDMGLDGLYLDGEFLLPAGP